MVTGPKDPKAGTLTEQQKERFIAHLTKVWPQGLPPCPMGHPTKWGVNPNVAQLPGFAHGGSLGMSGNTFPAVVMTCQTCFFMAPINAILAGLVMDPEAEKPTPESPSAVESE